MKKFTSFDSSNLDEVRTLLNQKLSELEKETGIKFTFNNISYSSTGFTTSLKAKITNGKSDTDLAKEEFEKYCDRFDVSKNLFGKKVSVGGKTFIVCGIRKYAERFPVEGREVGNDKIFNLPSTVKAVK